MTTRHRRSREEWARWVKRWEASGLPGTKFAQKHGLAHRSLYWWRGRLQTEGESDTSPTETFTEVRVREAEPEKSAAALEIVVHGGQVIRVKGQVDADQLRAVIEVVEGC